MSTAKLTPGARLLRSSRMFSLPNPLPTPKSTSLFGDPNLATLPYPTSQAIFSPHSSRVKGDWGLKRPLPLKTTLNTTTPMIRVKAIDAVEKLTDFSSAADTGLALERFEALGVAIRIPSKGTPISAFDENHDFVALRDGEVNKNNMRWKFKGPWLAKMQPGHLDNYLSKLRKRRPEFRELLRKKLAQKLREEQIRADLANGKPVNSEPQDLPAVTDEQLDAFMHSLRDDTSRHALFSYVGEFLDLPPVNPPDADVPFHTLRNQTTDQIDRKYEISYTPGSANPYGSEGPPPCHPSGGLSYLRTSAYLTNHPAYGPQKMTAVESRVVSPWKATTYGLPKIGVAGFVADVPPGNTEWNRRSNHLLNDVSQFDPEKPGGGKMYVAVSSVRINHQGKVVINVRDATAESVLVHKEWYRGEKIHDKALSDLKEKSRPMHRSNRTVYTQYNRQKTFGSSESYGLGNR